ncbi:metalloregulator ArsR/SmtB family transcription factor [Vibrio salinus]|uniref:metalloregulator ArsR/SmtB family transcription factor n=1 Tax=Vibrio salinus TaxID=2899784 RepID=UPI001E4F8D4D|nr:metalloregulator ArsR/SmtB family transcription factor [Vibrio salinus]MCE0493543.1 metalloregulator ArsR/SmtB family transcription factor [Vibrio salinus]
MLPHKLFKLLSDETRVRCLLLIAKEKQLCVCELTHALNESQPKISRHLAQLRQSGLLVDARQGKWVFYHLSSDLPRWIEKLIDGLAESNCLAREYETDKQRLAQMADRPCS